jgi:hypothetical protein
MRKVDSDALMFWPEIRLMSQDQTKPPQAKEESN